MHRNFLLLKKIKSRQLNYNQYLINEFREIYLTLSHSFLGVMMVNLIRQTDSTVFKLFVENLLDLVDQGGRMKRQNIFYFTH
jgi:hypothetical protein